MVAIGPLFHYGILYVDHHYVDDNDNDCGAIDGVVREFLAMAAFVSFPGLGWVLSIHPDSDSLAQKQQQQHFTFRGIDIDNGDNIGIVL